MVRHLLRGLSTLSLLSLVVLSLGCGAEGTLSLQVVLPEGADPLANVDELVLTVVQGQRRQQSRVTDVSQFSIELSTDVSSEISSITLEGLAGGKLVARGETPQIVLRPVDDTFKILVAPAGRLAGLKPRLPTSGEGMASTVLPGVGLFVAGGTDPQSGKPLAGATVYDVFEHQLVTTTPTLPEPRGGAVAVACGNECAVVALGRRSGDALATQLLQLYQGSWRSFDDGLAATQRREGAAVAGLPDGSSLVVGGVDASGAPLDTLLRLVPGSGGEAPELSLLAAPARAPRRAPAVAASTSGIVLIAGGHAAQETPVELFFASSQSTQGMPLGAGPEPRAGSAVVSLGSGRFALLGGVDEAGQPLADGWLIDAVAQTVKHVPQALKTARSGHQARRVGEQIVVVGGRDDKGLVDEAEVLSVATLAAVSSTPQQAPREGHVLWPIAPKTLLVAGGVAASGAATLLEVFQPDQR